MRYLGIYLQVLLVPFTLIGALILLLATIAAFISNDWTHFPEIISWFDPREQIWVRVLYVVWFFISFWVAGVLEQLG